MIEAASLQFFFFASLAIALFKLLPANFRSTVLLPVTNAVFLSLAMPNWSALACLSVFLGVAYLGIWGAYFRTFRLLLIVLVIVLFTFAYLKSYQILAILPYINKLPAIVGLSYIVIRSLQILIDVYEGTLKRPPGFWSFINFLCAWPMLLSGPIQNYQEFNHQINLMSTYKLNQEEIQKSFFRIVWGVFSVIVLAGLAHGIYHYFSEILIGEKSVNFSDLGLSNNFSFWKIFSRHDSPSVSYMLKLFFLGSKILSPIVLGLTAFSYLVFLYFNFSGYTDIVIGVGNFFGLQIPENFDRPWASRNFLDFWSRWHMTLANWFKTYVFNPQMRYFLRKWPNSTRAPYYGVLVFFTTFFLLGIWHGPTLQYIICSAALGFGVSLNKLWQLQNRKILGKSFSSWLIKNPLYKILSSSMALGYAAMSIIPFWCSTINILKLTFLFGIGGQLLAFLSTIVLAMPICTIALKLPKEKEFVVKVKPILTGAMLAITTIYVFLYPPFDLNFVYEAF